MVCASLVPTPRGAVASEGRTRRCCSLTPSCAVSVLVALAVVGQLPDSMAAASGQAGQIVERPAVILVQLRGAERFNMLLPLEVMDDRLPDSRTGTAAPAALSARAPQHPGQPEWRDQVEPGKT